MWINLDGKRITQNKTLNFRRMQIFTMFMISMFLLNIIFKLILHYISDAY
jgi:hypothetical protein